MMKRLSNSELWNRVTGLIGQTVTTLERHNPNPIEQVTDIAVIVKGRTSRIPRQQVEDAYRTLWESDEIRVHNVQWSGSSRDMLAVVPAILLAAVPDQIEKIVDGGLSGVRLKK